ncbi:MAG: amidase [Acidobacteriota bacterium]|nr:amidase [Acidobacteriota bacterium]
MTRDVPESLGELVSALRSGELSFETYFDRLEALVAEHEPQVLALLPEAERFSRLRRDAKRLEERFPEPENRPLLFGVPAGIKDIFHVDGFVTRAGSRVPAEELAGLQAASVTALEEAGALVFGKTVTTEFAYFGPGPTRNPHDESRTPGGSSSGSAAAVGARMCPIALGTQTIGSVSRPASFCGVVGFKPSYDRISRDGVIPLSPSLDHIGLFTTDCAGARLAASVLCTGWRDSERAMERPVLGVPEGPYLERAEAAGRDHFEAVIGTLATAGYEVRRFDAFGDIAEIEDRHCRIVAAEAARIHGTWYASHGETYHSKTAELIERGMEITDAELAIDRAGREELRSALVASMRAERIDLWISPAAPGVAPEGLDSTGNPVMNLPWSHAGLPTLALPAGTIDGLPMGLQLAAGWWEDEALFSWGAQLEHLLGARGKSLGGEE